MQDINRNSTPYQPLHSEIGRAASWHAGVERMSKQNLTQNIPAKAIRRGIQSQPLHTNLVDKVRNTSNTFALIGIENTYFDRFDAKESSKSMPRPRKHPAFILNRGSKRAMKLWRA